MGLVPLLGGRPIVAMDDIIARVAASRGNSLTHGRNRAKAVDEAAANSIISAEECVIRGLLSDVIFGVDEGSMEVVVLNMLGARGMAIFRGGAASADLGIAEQPAADSAAAAAQVRGDFGTDVGLAVVAAQPHDEQPAGTVFMNLAIGEAQLAQTVALPGDRNRFRNYAVINVLNSCAKR
jgi:hypothetical protein